MSTIESVAKSATDPESNFESVIESDSKSNSASDADNNSDPASQSESDFESEAESYSNSDPAFGGGSTLLPDRVRLHILDLTRL